MTSVKIGYTRCSTDKQDLEANRQTLLELGVSAERIYLDRAYSGAYRDRFGFDQALAAVRAGDSPVVSKLDCRARSVSGTSATPSPDAVSVCNSA